MPDLAVPPDLELAAPGNRAPLVVNRGPKGDRINVPYVTLTVCVPGTMTCQTVDHVLVSTAHVGLRILSAALPLEFTLPPAQTTNNETLAECTPYGADGYLWGGVHMADVTIGDELARSVRIQVVGRRSFPFPPMECSTFFGSNSGSVEKLGGNGVLGLAPFAVDCGSDCADEGTSFYFGCNGSRCMPVPAAPTDQVPNPVASLPVDKNGFSLQFPPIAPEGQDTISGSLVFGIGTTDNNQPAAAPPPVVLQLVWPTWELRAKYKDRNLFSYIDSATPAFVFEDASIPACGQGSIAAGFFCPPSTIALSAEISAKNGATSTVSFSVANAEMLLSSTAHAVLPNVAQSGRGVDFVWGFPFFVGRTVYFGLEGASTPLGKGPYIAY